MINLRSKMPAYNYTLGLPTTSKGMPSLSLGGIYGGSYDIGGLSGINAGVGVGLSQVSTSSGLGSIISGIGNAVSGGTIGGILSGVVAVFDGQSDVEAFTVHATRYFGEILPQLETIDDLSLRFTSISRHNEYLRLLYTTAFSESDKKKNSYKGNKIGLQAITEFIKKFNAYVNDLSKKLPIQTTTRKETFNNGFISGMEFNGNKNGSYRSYVVNATQKDLDALEIVKPDVTTSSGSNTKTGTGTSVKNPLYITIGAIAFALGLIYLLTKKIFK